MPREFNRSLTVASLFMALVAAGCHVSGPTQTTSKSVHLDDADSATVTLEISAGELRMSGGAAELMEGTFRFNVPEWEPVVDYRRDASRGVLTVKQPGFRPSFGNTQNTWDLRFSDRMPIALTAKIGAGESTLALGSLNLQSVHVTVGAGELTLDLHGTPARSYDVTVDASVGQTNIRLPRSVAIVATATAGIGGVSVSGLEKQGNTWINAGHEQDPVVMHVDVKGGVGQIELSAE